jgi:hypothetical protein
MTDPPDFSRPPDLQALLDRERPPIEPSVELREQVRAQILATLADAEGLEPEAVPARQAPRRGPARLRLAPKVASSLVGSLLAYAPMALAGFGLAAGVGVATYASLPQTSREAIRRVLHRKTVGVHSLPSVAVPIPTQLPLQQVEEPPPELTAPSVSPAMSPSPGEVAPSSPFRRPVIRPHVAVAPPPAPGLSSPSSVGDLSLGEEGALLERARSALMAGQEKAARAALAEHERRFADGRMAEQREALEIAALVQAGQRDEARERATRFRERYPRSLMLPLVDSAVDERPR